LRALGLLSGGLDSVLAVRIIQEQGVEVAGLVFVSPFFSDERAGRSAEELGITLCAVDITKPLLEAIRNPRYGLGKNLNPCADCHRIMIAEAFRRLESSEAAFVFTGEVLAQRPKSQGKDMLNAVAAAGRRGYLLRPLSAKLLPPTVPEREGWVDREKLLALSGRSRRQQIELASRYGISEYASPSGGCLLTDAGFCSRLRDLEGREGWARDDIELLKIGRHFRLPSGAKAVSGRDREENERLRLMGRASDLFFQRADRPRSLVLLRPGGEGDILPAARICARYSVPAPGGELEIAWGNGSGVLENRIRAKPMPDGELENWRI